MKTQSNQTTGQAEITSIETKAKTPFRFFPQIGDDTSAKQITVATVEYKIGKGKTTMMFSKWENETEWYCDAMMNKGIPVFVHGEGSRSCAKQIATDNLKEKLDTAASQLENK